MPVAGRPREAGMKKLIFIILLMSSPAWAQSKPVVAGKRVDNCAPIGRTADGKLVYSMKCENLPVPLAPPATAAVEASPPPAVAAEPEPDQGGLFKFPFPGLVKPTNEQNRPAGVGPAQPR
jgi:hypothetical protein